eukprot:COSAG01_NODE_1494_length_10125_cov_93.590805_9_plen_197_part_00
MPYVPVANVRGRHAAGQGFGCVERAGRGCWYWSVAVRVPRPFLFCLVLRSWKKKRGAKCVKKGVGRGDGARWSGAVVVLGSVPPPSPEGPNGDGGDDGAADLSPQERAQQLRSQMRTVTPTPQRAETPLETEVIWRGGEILPARRGPDSLLKRHRTADNDGLCGAVGYGLGWSRQPGGRPLLDPGNAHTRPTASPR